MSEGGKWVIPAANNSEITIRHSTKSYDAVITPTDPGNRNRNENSNCAKGNRISRR